MITKKENRKQQQRPTKESSHKNIYIDSFTITPHLHRIQTMQSYQSGKINDTDPMMKQGLSSRTAQLRLVREQQQCTMKNLSCFTTKMSPSSRPSYSSSQRTGMLDVVSNAVDEALTLILPEDSTTRRTSSISSPLVVVVNPTPIQPSGIQVVQTVPLSATWQDLHKKDLNTGTTDLIKWLFTTPQNARRTEEEEAYEPLDAFSSNGHHEQVESYDVDDVLANLNDGDIIPLDDAKAPKREKWEDRFQELLQYREKFGNCFVPHNWVGNKRLSSWVKRQRYQYKLWCKKEHSILTKERIEILNKVGFVWSSHHAIWDEKLNELKEFSIQHGHCNVPSRYAANQQLAIWVRSQRRQYKLMKCCPEQHHHHHHQDGSGSSNSNKKKKSHQSYMTRERFEKLQSLGFVFDPRCLVK